MRIVTVHTRHAVAADPFALAHPEFLHLADAAAHHAVVGVDEVGKIVSDAVTRLVVIHRAAGVFDSGVALQMATDANRVAPFGIEFDRVDHGSFAKSRDMRSSVSVT